MTRRKDQPSTRHWKAEAEDCTMFAQVAGVPPYVATEVFLGEPMKMARNLALWASRKDDPAAALYGWAMERKRGIFNPENPNYNPDAIRTGGFSVGRNGG